MLFTRDRVEIKRALFGTLPGYANVTEGASALISCNEVCRSTYQQTLQILLLRDPTPLRAKKRAREVLKDHGLY